MVLTKKAVSQYFPDVTTSKANAALKNLKGTRKLLSNKERWGTGNFEIRFEENPDYDCNDPDDSLEKIELKLPKYCLIGATEKIDGPGEILADRLLLYAIGQPFWDEDSGVDDFSTRDDTESVQNFNDDDDTKHRDILKLLDRSIKLAEKMTTLVPAKLPKVKA